MTEPLRDTETEQMIAVLAECIPHDLNLDNEREVAEYLCAICAFASYRPSAMERNLSEIIKHAKALRHARAA
jgi:nitrate reductase assembly molybdenum cofactor insertion protein NarJ